MYNLALNTIKMSIYLSYHSSLLPNNIYLYQPITFNAVTSSLQLILSLLKLSPLNNWNNSNAHFCATLLTLLLIKNRPQNSQQRYETGR